MSRKRCQATNLIEDLKGLREIRCELKVGHEREHWSGNYAWAGIKPSGSAAHWERILGRELARLDELLADVQPLVTFSGVDSGGQSWEVLRHDRLSQPGLTRRAPP